MKFEKLSLKNVGPIKNIDLDLKQCMVFIGPQSSGKSVISKLIAIFRNIEFILNTGSTFEKLLLEQNISKFISKKSKLTYTSQNYSYEFENGKGLFKNLNNFNIDSFKTFLVDDAKYIEIRKNIDEYKGIIDTLKSLSDTIKNLDEGDERNDLIEEFNSLIETSNSLNNNLGTKISEREELFSNFQSLSNYSVYVPAERSIIPLLSQSSLTLLNNKVDLEVIPKYILSFGEQFEAATKSIKSYSIDFLGISYSNENDQKRVLTNNKNPILLSESSSGIQSLLPALLVIENTFDLKNKGQTFIVEEPEMNLYPSAQKEFVYYLVNRCTKKNESHFNELIITTHSPYVLSAFNNLLLASKTGKIERQKTAKIIAEENWLSNSDFGAYFVKNGLATSIVNEMTNMIDEDELDSASLEIMSEFNQLFEIYKNA